MNVPAATSIDVAAGTFTDAEGDNNQAATQFNWTYDTVSPTMTITAANGGGSAVADGATSSDANLTVTFTSNEATSNFAAGDITVSGDRDVTRGKITSRFIRGKGHG